jgi:hypothetical protein
MAIRLTKFTKNVNNIQALSDKPNETDGLTAEGLKEKFDKAGYDIKTFINETLIQEIEENINTMNYVADTDERLSNSRKCNNTFDNSMLARQNLKINYGSELPSSGEDGDIFFLY